MNKLLLAAAVSGATLFPAMAADLTEPVAASEPTLFGYIEGAYLFKEAGDGIVQRTAPPTVKAGDGGSGAGEIGYRLDSNWDVAARFRIWSLGAGETDHGGPVNDFGVDASKGYHIDAQVGYRPNIAPDLNLRTFAGIRYLRWDQDYGFHPDAPLNCCFMNTKATGVGPVIGLDGSYGVTEKISIIGGAELAVLFGDLDQNGGTGIHTGAPDSVSRTFLNAGGYVGAQYNFTDKIGLALGYRADLITNAGFSEFNLNGTAPDGKSDILVHGVFARLAFKFGN